MKYGESLTSPEVMSRLAEGEKRKKGEQSKDLKRENNKKKKLDRDGKAVPQKPRHGSDGDRDVKITDTKSSTQPSLTIESDVYYAVMFTSPPAYYIGRPLNVSTPPDGEEYIVKFLNRGPNNTYVLPARDKIENVQKQLFLCKAELEGAGPFHLKNYDEVEKVFKRQLKALCVCRTVFYELDNGLWIIFFNVLY